MKIKQHIEKIEEARECHSDATSCHKTGKGSTGHGFAYICPKTFSASEGRSRLTNYAERRK